MRSDKVRSALLEQPDGTVIESPPQTWVPSVLVPLVQNIIGGLAVAALVGVVWRWVSGSLPVDWWVPALSAGAVWATIWTIVRFFADDLGLLRAAYAAGAASRDAQVNALMLEVQSMRDVIAAGEAGPTSSTADRRIATANATLKNSRVLLKVLYEDGVAQITRAKMGQRGMGESDWKRAVLLCRAAGVIDEHGQPRHRDYAIAMKEVERVHGAGVQSMSNSKRGGVPWG